MFGSLKLQRCITTPEVYRRYRRYYCGLCQKLATDYGLMGRFLLNYDTTFLYILLSSVAGSAPEPQKIHCPAAPWRRTEGFVIPELSRFAAAVTLYLAGMKLRDDLLDECRVHQKLAAQCYRQRITAAQLYLEKQGIDLKRAETIFHRQHQLERERAPLSQLCRPTEEGLKYLFAEGGRLFAPPSDQAVLGELGSALGRIIYVLDSFVDLPTDYKCNRFNALASHLGDQAVINLKIPETTRVVVTELLAQGLAAAKTQTALLGQQTEKELLTAIYASLERQIKYLVLNTETLAELEAKVKTGSVTYLLSHPRLFLKSRAATRYYYQGYGRRSDGCCNLCTMAACCEASDCDCDSAEFCLSGGNPCELLECFCCG